MSGLGVYRRSPLPSLLGCRRAARPRLTCGRNTKKIEGGTDEETDFGGEDVGAVGVEVEDGLRVTAVGEGGEVGGVQEEAVEGEVVTVLTLL